MSYWNSKSQTIIVAADEVNLRFDIKNGLEFLQL